MVTLRTRHISLSIRARSYTHHRKPHANDINKRTARSKIAPNFPLTTIDPLQCNLSIFKAITTYAETKMTTQEDDEAVSRLQEEDDEPNEDREEYKHDAIPDIIIKQETEDDSVPDECQYNTYDRKRHPPPVTKFRRAKRTSFKMEQPETEFDIFCRSVALQLNNMPLENALRLQHNIQNLVTEERLNCLHSQQRHESMM